MIEELIDRFGEPPKSVNNLLFIAQLKAKAHAVYFTEVTQRGNEIRFVLYEKAGVNPAKIPELVQKYENRVSFSADSKAPYFVYRLNCNSRQKGEDAGTVIAEFLDHAREILLESL